MTTQPPTVTVTHTPDPRRRQRLNALIEKVTAPTPAAQKAS